MARQKSGAIQKEMDAEGGDGLAKPLVFISHDSRDAKLAEAFSNLLTGVSAGVLKSFRSSDKKGSAGIEYGSEWYTRIMTALHESTDVVALLTQHSIGRPWILFEAGVAKGNRGRDSVVFGVALGVPLDKSLTGPFAQFQNCGDDEDELTKLVMQLIRRVPNADPDEGAIRRQVQAFRQSVSEILKQPVKASAEGVDETTVAKLFEEVKVLFRELPQQVESKLREMGSDGRRKRRRRFHPMMLEDVLHQRELFMEDREGSDSLSWLLFVSLLRDDAPWFYELGMEVYRALRSGNATKLNEARKDFQRMARAMRHGHPMMMDMFGEDEESFMTMRHIPMVADRFLDRMKTSRPLAEDETVNTDEDGLPAVAAGKQQPVEVAATGGHKTKAAPGKASEKRKRR